MAQNDVLRFLVHEKKKAWYGFLLLLLLFCIKLLHHKDLKFPETIVFIYLFWWVCFFRPKLLSPSELQSKFWIIDYGITSFVGKDRCFATLCPKKLKPIFYGLSTPEQKGIVIKEGGGVGCGERAWWWWNKMKQHTLSSKEKTFVTYFSRGEQHCSWRSEQEFLYERKQLHVIMPCLLKYQSWDAYL